MRHIFLPLLVMMGAMTSSYAAEKPHYTMGTGSIGATYYPLGKAICNLVNANKLSFTCEAVSTGGSVYNLKSVRNKTHDFAVSQAFVQHQAYAGSQVFEGEGKHSDLRTVIPLHTEIMLLTALAESNITSFADLEEKNVNLGNVGSGTHTILKDLLDHNGLDDDFFAEVFNHKSGNLPQLFCDKTIDAAIYSTGHPNKIYTTLSEECGVRFIDLWDKKIAAFVAQNNQFIQASLPPNIYKDQEQSIQGFGIPVVLSASQTMPEQHVFELLHVITEQHNTIKTIHPIFNTIAFRPTVFEAMAPYHNGTTQFFNSQ